MLCRYKLKYDNLLCAHMSLMFFFPFCRSFWKWSVVVLCFPQVVTLFEFGNLYSGVWIDFIAISYHRGKHHLSS